MTWPDRDQLLRAWQIARTTVLDREWLRRAITRNFTLKLLSLAIAFGLWLFVNFGERDTEESFKVPLELRNIPAHLMITSPRADFIDLRVTGPRTLLARIDRSRLSISLDLNGVRPGPAVFRVGADSLNLPRGVKVVRITPAQATLELDRVARKMIPVQTRLVGKLPPDLQLISTKVSPDSVQVAGPVKDVDELHVATTEAFDLSKVGVGTTERELPLDMIGEYVSLSAARVSVEVHVDEVPATRELHETPIRVRNAASAFRVIPETVRLTVHGPKSLVSKLRLEADAVSLDAANLAPGTYVRMPTVVLPDGAELVAVKPAKVTLVMLRPKRGRAVR